ncbi:hypothetical protein D9M71_644130 [compost metagenome]
MLGIGRSPTAGQVVTELADQHRCRALAVIANAATDPAHIELVACRQQGLQQQIAVILTPRAIAWTVVAAHEVEVQRRLCPRVVAIVHPQQAHQLERDRAHGHQGAEVDRPGQKALGQAPLIETGQPGFTDDGQRQLVVQADRLTILQPGLTQRFQLRQQVLVMLVTGLEKK